MPGKYGGGKRKKGNYVAKIVNKILAKRVEDKYHDIFGSLSPTAGPGYVLQLINGIGQGAGDFNRVGNEVCAGSLHARLGITFPDVTNRVRVMLFWDKQPNGTVPTAADLLTYTLQAVDSFLNPDSKARFHVIYDKLLSGGANGTVATSINRKFNLRKKRVLFKGTTDDIASIQSNALYLLVMSDSVATPHPDIRYMFRYIYSDM